MLFTDPGQPEGKPLIGGSGQVRESGRVDGDPIRSGVDPSNGYRSVIVPRRQDMSPQENRLADSSAMIIQLFPEVPDV